MIVPRFGIHSAILLLSATIFINESTGITRDEILERAKAYAEHWWTITAKNTVASCSNKYSCDYTPGTYQGLPYDWGGYVEIAKFDQLLLEGQAAGSHSWHGVLSCTTGLDCSGFTSKCWKAPHHSTSTMYKITDEIPPTSVLPGDAYNKAGSHIVVWVKQAGDGSPVFYEAAGTPHKVRLHTSATWAYLSGYKSIRYHYVAEINADAPGAPDNPIVIESFPFYDERNTLSTGINQFDAYSCAPEKGELGPEIVYLFSVKQPGYLTATVTDAVGVDIDLHLLSALDAQACLERHDTQIGPTLITPGTYWLVADTWSNANGVTYPGPYALDVDFEPTGEIVEPEDDEDPVEEGTIGDPDAEPTPVDDTDTAPEETDAGSQTVPDTTDEDFGGKDIPLDAGSTPDIATEPAEDSSPLDNDSFDVPGATEPDLAGNLWKPGGAGTSGDGNGSGAQRGMNQTDLDNPLVKSPPSKFSGEDGCHTHNASPWHVFGSGLIAVVWLTYVRLRRRFTL